MPTNVVTSEDVAAKKKTTQKKETIKKEVNITTDTVIVYYESGNGYVTTSGYKFTRQNPMREVTREEANILLRLSNFRLPSDEEKSLYLTNKEV